MDGVTLPEVVVVGVTEPPTTNFAAPLALMSLSSDESSKIERSKLSD